MDNSIDKTTEEEKTENLVETDNGDNSSQPNEPDNNPQTSEDKPSNDEASSENDDSSSDRNEKQESVKKQHSEKQNGGKKPKKGRLIKGILIALGTLVLILAILVAAAFGVYMHYYSKLDHVTNSDYISGTDSVYRIEQIDEDELLSASYVTNILLIGTDERTSYFSTNARADSMIVCSINTKTKVISLVSLERGMTVKYLSGENTYSYDLLTHVFKYGGAELLINTIESTFKIKIDGYVRANFNAFEQIIDLLGGVNVYLTEAEVDALMNGNNTGEVIDRTLTVGNNHLSGSEALIFSRLRSIDSDFGRVKRQRRVLVAIKNKLSDCSVTELMDIADKILPLVRTDIDSTTLLSVFYSASLAISNDVQQTTIPISGSYSKLDEVDFDANIAFLEEYLYQDGSSEN